MKTLVLNGSPRKNGDTVSLINVVSDSLEGDIRKVDTYFTETEISPCIDCRYCRDKEGCAIHDGMDAVYAYIQECDNILVASPIYFSELTGRLLDFGSRLQTYYSARFFQHRVPIAKPKRGAVILVGGGDGDMGKAYDTACTLLTCMNCKEIYPLVFSHNTDKTPAVEDGSCLNGVKRIAGFFNSAGPIVPNCE